MTTTLTTAEFRDKIIDAPPFGLTCESVAEGLHHVADRFGSLEYHPDKVEVAYVGETDEFHYIRLTVEFHQIKPNPKPTTA